MSARNSLVVHSTHSPSNDTSTAAERLSCLEERGRWRTEEEEGNGDGPVTGAESWVRLVLARVQPPSGFEKSFNSPVFMPATMSPLPVVATAVKRAPRFPGTSLFSVITTSSPRMRMSCVSLNTCK